LIDATGTIIATVRDSIAAKPSYYFSIIAFHAKAEEPEDPQTHEPSMLSQLRWIFATAIGVAIVIAVWLEPEVRDPSGEPATPRTAPIGGSSAHAPSGQAPQTSPGLASEPTGSSSVSLGDSPSVEWQDRLRAYWSDVDRILARRQGNKADHDKVRDALRARHFTVEERPTVRALDASRDR
jgi:hypothetical protein